MKTIRWRVRTLLGVICVVALVIKGALVVEERYYGASRRRAALIRLAETLPRPASAEPALVAALDDRDAGVRYTALCALHWTGSTSPAMVRPLVELLEAETEQPQYNTAVYPFPLPIPRPAEALKRIKAPAAVLAPLLRKAMGSPHRWMRLQATEVLCDAAGRPGPPAPDLAPLLLAALQDPELAIRMGTPEALAHLDADARRKAIAILLDRLRQPDRPAQLLATVGLARFDPEGQAAVAILADRLRDNEAAARRPAPPPTDPDARPDAPVIAIQMIKPGEPGQEVGGILGARLLDLYLLGRLGPVAKPAVPEVVRAMMSRDAEQQVPFFLNAFSPRQGTWDSSVVENLLNSYPPSGDWSRLPPNEWSRSPPSLGPLGAAVLGRIGPEAERQAVDILVGMLRDEDESRRAGAVDALGALGPRASTAIPLLLELAERKAPAWPGEEDWRAVHRLMGALEKVCKGDDPRLATAMIRMLKSSDAMKRSGAASILSHLNPPAPTAVPALIEALKDETQGVRHSSAVALGRYEGTERKAAVPALIDALQDEDEEVRSNVAKSLVRYGAGAGRVVPTAIGLLRSENPSLRARAAEILGAFGPAAGSAVPALREVRHDPESFVRDAAEKALKSVAPAEAADPVE